MIRLDKLWRTTALRITAAYLAVFAATILIVGAVAYFGASELWRAEIQDTVEGEIRALTQDHASQDDDLLVETIAERAEEAGEEGFAYLLLDKEGRVLAGQLPGREAVEGWQDFAPPWDEDEPLIAKGVHLPDGRYLLVAHDAEALNDMIEFIWEGLIWSFAIVLPLALLGGILVSVISLKRVEVINRATREIRRGDLTRRIPLAGTNDEFDRLATNINAMLDGIQDLTDGLRRVSQDIAHDMRTPLTRVRQKLDLAITNAKSGNGNGKILTSTVEDIDTLLEAFNALLRIAQIQSGTRRAGFQAFDLSETLKHLFGDYESVAEDSGRHISAELEDAITLVGDKPLIVQMMVNLIENAIRHTPEGTAIVLRLNEAPGRIEIMLADNGPGIPEAERERVFRRFYRRDASRHTPGSGLGLSLVTAVAELHNIELRLDDNQPGLRVTLSFRPTSQL